MASGGHVCLLFLVWLATFVGSRGAIPQPPPSPPSPAPVTCESQNGQVYNLGDTYQYGCMPCECKADGEECYPLPCPPPPCQNYVTEGPGCCPQCPNTTPQPPPSPPSTAPVTCESQNGQVYNLGDTYQYGCMPCECKADGEVCYPLPCQPPTCQNYVTEGPGCCPQCPNGPDCMDPSTGEIIPAGKTVETTFGKHCYCPAGSGNYGEIQEPMCYYLDVFTTTPPPSRCYANGQYYQEGEYYYPEPCLTCYCRSYWQEPECYPPSCTVPPCPNPVSQGYCCATCPNGPACFGLQGDEIPQGETRTYEDGTQCSCDSPDYFNGLHCTPFTPTPPFAPPAPPAP